MQLNTKPKNDEIDRTILQLNVNDKQHEQTNLVLDAQTE
jgi:hypothetical protein